MSTSYRSAGPCRHESSCRERGIRPPSVATNVNGMPLPSRKRNERETQMFSMRNR